MFNRRLLLTVNDDMKKIPLIYVQASANNGGNRIYCDDMSAISPYLNNGPVNSVSGEGSTAYMYASRMAEVISILQNQYDVFATNLYENYMIQSSSTNLYPIKRVVGFCVKPVNATASMYSNPLNVLIWDGTAANSSYSFNKDTAVFPLTGSWLAQYA